MQEHIESFIERVGRGEIEIYNEFSLQHELGIHLREALNSQNAEPTKVQFERNVSFFDLQKDIFEKKEIDVCIFNADKTHCEVIELKFPRNGQHPEQMFSFCKDLVFLEQLLDAGFKKASLLILAHDPLFYTGGGEGIYPYFRCGKPLTGRIQKPTGKKDKELYIKGTYYIKWHPIMGELKYALIEARL